MADSEISLFVSESSHMWVSARKKADSDGTCVKIFQPTWCFEALLSSPKCRAKTDATAILADQNMQSKKTRSSWAQFCQTLIVAVRTRSKVMERAALILRWFDGSSRARKQNKTKMKGSASFVANMLTTYLLLCFQ